MYFVHGNCSTSSVRLKRLAGSFANASMARSARQTLRALRHFVGPNECVHESMRCTGSKCSPRSDCSVLVMRSRDVRGGSCACKHWHAASRSSAVSGRIASAVLRPRADAWAPLTTHPLQMLRASTHPAKAFANVLSQSIFCWTCAFP